MLAFYNVENLMDTIDDPEYNDDDFLPSAERRWNSFRYHRKLELLAKVLMACDTFRMPDLIGLAEVENKRVLEDLIRLTPLQYLGYEFISLPSPDLRGIQTALLFKSGQFEPNHYEALAVKRQNGSPTRDILYVQGRIKGQQLRIFVNHWPSRWGGLLATQADRKIASDSLAAKVQALQTRYPDDWFVIMGDFNDERSNQSINSLVFSTDIKYIQPVPLNTDASIGTLVYQSQPYIFDFFMLHMPAVPAATFRSFIINHDWMLDKEFKPARPYRTYKGTYYLGGYSDHLPVVLIIEWPADQ